jgi:hypothetical protein
MKNNVSKKFNRIKAGFVFLFVPVILLGASLIAHGQTLDAFNPKR